jgi:FixJ family two-component response regulator
MVKTPPLIAVVDDEEAVCRALRRLLVASSLDVITFPSGELFLDSLTTNEPDCIVLDLHMPGLNGLDLLKRLANVGRRIPVIVVTGRDDQGARATCIAAGAHAYLAKPLDHAKLLRAISDAVERANSATAQHGPGD